MGLALKFHTDALKQIGYESVDECLIEMLTVWLNKAYKTAQVGEPSWTLVVAAVAHPAGGGDLALAERIANKYNVPIPVPTSTLPTKLSCGKPTFV